MISCFKPTKRRVFKDFFNYQKIIVETFGLDEIVAEIDNKTLFNLKGFLR